MGWIYLLLAILFEVAAALLLKQMNGLRNIVPTILVVVFYIICFFLSIYFFIFFFFFLLSIVFSIFLSIVFFSFQYNYRRFFESESSCRAHFYFIFFGESGVRFVDREVGFRDE